MSHDKLFLLADVEVETGESRHLINFLIHDREIPFRFAGMAKVLDEGGLRLLKAAIKEYHRKPSPDRPPARPKVARKGRGRTGRTKGGPTEPDTSGLDLCKTHGKADPIVA